MNFLKEDEMIIIKGGFMPSNSKYFCPKCKRMFKNNNECPFCKIKMICMGKKWRFPKHNASGYTWKKELKKLIWRVYNKDLKDLYFYYNLPYIVEICVSDEIKKIKKELKNEIFIEEKNYTISCTKYLIFPNKKILKKYKKELK